LYHHPFLTALPLHDALPIYSRSYDANDQLLARQSYYYNLVQPEQAYTANLNTDARHLFRASGLGEMDRTRASLLLVKSATTEYEDRKSTRLNSSHVSISYAV